MTTDRGTCDNCGTPDEERQKVHRVYLHPEPERVEETEQWCASCTSQYPHEVAGD